MTESCPREGCTGTCWTSHLKRRFLCRKDSHYETIQKHCMKHILCPVWPCWCLSLELRVYLGCGTSRNVLHGNGSVLSWMNLTLDFWPRLETNFSFVHVFGSIELKWMLWLIKLRCKIYWRNSSNFLLANSVWWEAHETFWTWLDSLNGEHSLLTLVSRCYSSMCCLETWVIVNHPNRKDPHATAPGHLFWRRNRLPSFDKNIWKAWKQRC